MTPPLLICGATGTLGQAFARTAGARHIRFELTDRRALDLHDEGSIAAALDRLRPWAVIDATGWVRVDDAESDPDGCLRTNFRGATLLARAADGRGIPTLHISSDLVFDGRLHRLYVETDAPAPLNVYGRSKAKMEQAVLALPGAHLVIRAAAFFGPDDHNFAAAVARELGAGRRFAAAADQVVTPTFVPDLVDAALDLLIDEATGVWHLSHGRALSWTAFAREVAGACGLDPSMIDGVPGRDLGQAAPRPAQAGLGVTQGSLLPSFESALERFATGRARRAAAGELRAA